MTRTVLALGMMVATAAVALAQAPAPADEKQTAPPTSLAEMPMKPIMSQVIYPTSDAVFYVTTRKPKNDADWAALLKKTETLAEAAAIMVRPTHRRDRDRWITDAQLMIDASTAAVAAAKNKDVDAMAKLNEP